MRPARKDVKSASVEARCRKNEGPVFGAFVLATPVRNSAYSIDQFQSSMKRVPVAYYQEVLDKISHADRATFRKELRKAFRRLLPEEREELKQWFRSSCVCRPALHAELQRTSAS